MAIFGLKPSAAPEEETREEVALIHRMQAGDRRAQEEIFKRYKDRIYSLCLRMTADRSAAEDLTQDAFVTLFQKAGTFRGEAKFSSWFHRLASNLTISYLRRHNRLVFPQSDDEPAEDALQRLPGMRKQRSLLDGLQLQQALERLPEGYRVVFVLYEVAQYSHEEIAEMQGCSVNTSKTQLFKARKRLRELLS
jgi:RNA polymerase sigma-70 factor (ECF subfamily)